MQWHQQVYMTPRMRTTKERHTKEAPRLYSCCPHALYKCHLWSGQTQIPIQNTTFPLNLSSLLWKLLPHSYSTAICLFFSKNNIKYWSISSSTQRKQRECWRHWPPSSGYTKWNIQLSWMEKGFRQLIYNWGWSLRLKTSCDRRMQNAKCRASC